VFVVAKRLWSFAKVRYGGLDKNTDRGFAALGRANLCWARNDCTSLTEDRHDPAR